MEEDIHPNDDQEALRRRLELLKQEYERTAVRLQRAERLDAIRRQSNVSHQNNETSACLTSSSVAASELSDNQNAQHLQTALQFQLAEIALAPHLSSPACMRSPAHRLRSKRSRLRLQNKERESDTDNSQEKESLKQGNNGGGENKADMRKERHMGMLPAKVEKNQDNDTIAEEPQELKVVNCENKPLVLCKNKHLPFQSQMNICQESLPLIHHSVEKLQSKTAACKDSMQASSSLPSCESVHNITVKSEANLAQMDAYKGNNDSTDNKHSLIMSGALDSCTLVEGLPFPVEYYIRTTRRMAASHSPVNLEAVIHSQLTRGRGRRRLGQSQTRGRGHTTSEHSESVCRSNDQAGRRGNGQRRRRGRRRATTVRTKDAQDCIISNPVSDSQASIEPLTVSTPQTESSCQSEVEGRPQAESQPIPSLVSAVNLTPSKEERVTQDFKHLPDSQLYFESKLLPDSNLYPIFRRGRGQTGNHLSPSQTSMCKNDQSPLLPSLASLIQALQDQDTKNELLAAVDVQDFHLPDEDFGQLKLERLQLSTSLVEPYVQRVYNTRRSNRRQTASGKKSNFEVFCGELFAPEAPTTSALEDSLPLCQSDPTDQSQTEKQNTIQSDKHPVNKPSVISYDLTESVKEQTLTIAKTDETEQEAVILTEKHTASIDQMQTETETKNVNMLDINPQVESHKRTDTLLENHILCPALLDLSPSLTSHTPRGQYSPLPSLGMTPYFVSSGSPTDPQTRLLSPANSCRSPSLNIPTGSVSPDSVSSKQFGNVKADTFMKSSDPTEVEDTVAKNPTNVSQEIMMGARNDAEPTQNNTVMGHENFITPETELNVLCILGSEEKHECSFDTDCKSKINCTPEIEAQLNPDIQNNPETKDESFRAESQSYMDMNRSRCGNESGCAGQTSNEASTNQKTEEKTVCITNVDEAMENGTDSCNTITLLNENPVSSTTFPDAGHCSSMLQEMHTFKALEGGCVLDLCLVRWSTEDWCICVAGEWSVCVWIHKKGVQPWGLVHTWTFAQSVMSLQAIPDSSGLVCVTLGHLEITEARLLACPSMDGPFTQTLVCKDALQAVVGVSDCRLVCCSASEDQQKVTVKTFNKEGRVVSTLPMDSVKQNIRTLAAIEEEKDALIGWTECKTVLIWNMKSGHLLQSILLEKTLTMTNCMKGYSYRGVLCILLQNTGNVCDERRETSLFALIATNPLTGKHITLTSISSPAQHIQQLIDGDVLGSELVGVFQSGHVAVWNLKSRVAKVVGVLDELCRLARWAGPDTLLTGYLNGDVSVFQYKTL
nr:uncharacterized protein palb2 isoform X2 [Misgurnus anguillicaudatus]XP_055061997.1 uncharacterized protein palb2 isoform X2 [Misgurnus anguillicaudatus]XP_055061998.1 uncharacterized protein palb2 isoform X2 [Misgurnus anguillicaudatus]XP_055061999.1 uncharacterized protein palb2 isoform X2 [Misgurnus anguillicaudatus]